MIRYTIATGEPTPDESLAIEDALKQHQKAHPTAAVAKSIWSRPQLRTPLPRKV